MWRYFATQIPRITKEQIVSTPVLPAQTSRLLTLSSGHFQQNEEGSSTQSSGFILPKSYVSQVPFKKTLETSGYGSGVLEVHVGERKAFVKPYTARPSPNPTDLQAAREVIASVIGRCILDADVPVIGILEKEENSADTPRCISYALAGELTPYRDMSPWIDEISNISLEESDMQKVEAAKNALHTFGSTIALDILLGACDRHPGNLLYHSTTNRWISIDYAQSFNTRFPSSLGHAMTPYGDTNLGQGHPPAIYKAISEQPTLFQEAARKISKITNENIQDIVNTLPPTHLSDDGKQKMSVFIKYRRDHFPELADAFFKSQGIKIEMPREPQRETPKVHSSSPHSR